MTLTEVWLGRHSIVLLRISLGVVFLGFGALKFIPGLSPVQTLTAQTVDTLTLGLFPDGVGLPLVGALETAIGLCLLTGRFVRLGVVLLGLAMIGILAPLVLFPERLFSRRFFAPTLEGQYVLKDLVLLAAGLVVAATAFGKHPIGRAGPQSAGRGAPERLHDDHQD